MTLLDGWRVLETVTSDDDPVPHSVMAAKCIDGIGVIAYWRRGNWPDRPWELWIVDTEQGAQMDQTYDPEQGEVPVAPPFATPKATGAAATSEPRDTEPREGTSD